MAFRERPSSSLSSTPLGIPPPPDVPPRRNINTGFPGATAPSSSGSDATLPSTDMRSKPALGKAFSMYTSDSSLICEKSKSKDRMSLPQEQMPDALHHPDLVGLDFSNIGSSHSTFASTETLPKSSSVEDLKETEKTVYPEIRHVFREISGTQLVTPMYPSHRNNEQRLLGFNNRSSASSSPVLGTSSSPILSNIHRSHSPNFQLGSINPNMMNPFNPTNNFPSLPPSAMPTQQKLGENKSPSISDLSGNQRSMPLFNLPNPMNPQQGLPNTAAFNTNTPKYNWNDFTGKPMGPPSLKSNLFIPNIQRVASTGDMDQVRESSQSPIDNSLNSPMAAAGLDDDVVLPMNIAPNSGEDLISLGPSSSEHEYLSLEYFDPLYIKARQESICSKDVLRERNFSNASHFSFGEAFPNVSSAENSTQDPFLDGSEFDIFNFKGVHQASTENEKSQPPLTSAEEAKKKDEKPPHLPAWDALKDSKYLRKRHFVDPDSESFCQMVADLKCQYLSTDMKSNLGYLINQIQEHHVGSLQVKLVVYSSFSVDPVILTCDTNTLVEHVISHVLYTIAPSDSQPESDKFIVKVFDRTEYLVNDLPLAKFEYTHSCMKLDKDLRLELISCEEVCRPFIRTTDDDGQILYFPREYISSDGISITQEALTILLEAFYKEVDALLTQVKQETFENIQYYALRQSVKAICVNLSKIEITEVKKSYCQLIGAVTEFNNPGKKSQGMYETSGSLDEEAEKAIIVAVRCALREEIEIWVEKLVDAVKSLLRMYCNTFLTDFMIGPAAATVPLDTVEVVKIRDSFIVGMASAHRIPSAWQGKFEEYKLVCSLFHGTKKLLADLSTSFKPLTSNLCEAIVWDEWLQFENIYLNTLPREARLCIVLCGLRTAQSASEKNAAKGDSAQKTKQITFPLCAAAIQLYNEKGFLHQGPQLVPLVMGAGSDPIMPSCKTLLPDSVLLQVNLPDFEKNIFFPPPLDVDVPVQQFKTLSPEIQSVLTSLMEKGNFSVLSAEDLKCLWTYRHYLTDWPFLLPCILHAAELWDWASLSDIYGLLRCWNKLDPMQAFELFLPQFPDIRVRELATECLNRMPTDDLICFLPQMIQALKFESYHNSPLAKLLLEQSCKSPRFAHQFFWLLKGVASQDPIFKRRYELMFVALASVAGDATYQEFKKQEELVKIMTSVAEKVKTAKDKDATLKRGLLSLHEMLEKRMRVLLPYNPSMEVVGLDVKSCSYFNSNALPLRLVFKNSNQKADSHYAICKVGDDLRQDMLTMQMIGIMDSLWLQNNLDLRMITFSCLATGPKKGIIELITESNTLRKIQVSRGVTGSFKDRPIKEWLQKHNPTELEYKTAVENFTHSCAGYCVATYVLGVCDRHNDNIMLKESGHMFHIDFSKFLGDAQMFGIFNRDRVPFVLTSDMAFVINDGSKPGNRFQDFVDLCCQAFNILRRHAHLFRSLLTLMARSGIPNVTEQAIHYVENALLPGQNDAQATATFTRMIEESMKSMSTQLNFFIHNLAQLKSSNHTEGELLSFVSKTYSKETDGPIRSVELTEYQKRYTPDKHYIFILKVARENQKVPSYIFRHFSEFVEFRDKLNETFSLVTWPNFSTRVVIGRSNVRSVAESRKAEIQNFLEYLWSKAGEITECDLVYTFFHPLLRDEQETIHNQPNVPKLKAPAVQRANPNTNSGIKGQIKLSISHSKEKLQVMVMHIRGLAEEPELPSPYVKIYLLPDPEKKTKQKTKLVKSTSHPTYNELLQYPLKLQEIYYRVLQVTVWNQVVLKENHLLGAVYIRLRDIDFKQDNTVWHQLGRMQMDTVVANG